MPLLAPTGWEHQLPNLQAPTWRKLQLLALHHPATLCISKAPTWRKLLPCTTQPPCNLYVNQLTTDFIFSMPLSRCTWSSSMLCHCHEVPYHHLCSATIMMHLIIIFDLPLSRSTWSSSLLCHCHNVPDHHLCSATVMMYLIIIFALPLSQSTWSSSLLYHCHNVTDHHLCSSTITLHLITFTVTMNLITLFPHDLKFFMLSLHHNNLLNFLFSSLCLCFSIMISSSSFGNLMIWLIVVHGVSVVSRCICLLTLGKSLTTLRKTWPNSVQNLDGDTLYLN